MFRAIDELTDWRIDAFQLLNSIRQFVNSSIRQFAHRIDA